MKKVLFISFDLIRDGEPGISLSAASLIAYLKNAETYGDVFSLEHQTINCYQTKSEVDAFEDVFNLRSLDSINTIALSSHIWSEKYVQYFIKKLRKQNWTGLIVLGGPQMNDSNENLRIRYADANILIQGYGEASFLKVCENIDFYKGGFNILSLPTSTSLVPPVYSNGIIALINNQPMVRLETKRNCPYNCSFCHFTDYTSNKVNCLNYDNIKQELMFLKQKGVKKINIMDPTFNILNHQDIIDYISLIKYKSLFTFQTHFNALKKNMKQKLNAFKKINSHLEFGLQSTNPKTLTEVNRKHDLSQIKQVIKEMVSLDMSFEISLIYGLPYQTVTNFKDSVKFLIDLGVKNIYGFPLQLYNGTQLYNNKDNYGIISKPNDLLIPEVVSTKWMSEEDINYLNNWMSIKTK